VGIAGAPEALPHGREARARLNGIGAAHSGIVELVDNLIAGPLREGLDGLAMPRVAISRIFLRSECSPRRQ
jgi:hypothetical protein